MSNIILDVIIEVAPKAKERPRLSVDNKGAAHVYTPSDTKSAQQTIAFYSRQWMREHKKELSEAPLLATLGFWFHTDDPARANGPHTLKPDLDNMVKLVFDSLNGVAYKDDKQIIHLSCSKGWSLKPSAVSIFIVESEKD